MAYMPKKEALQVSWSQRFATVVAAKIATYGVPTAIMTAVTDANDALQSAWLLADNAATRTRGTIATKNDRLRAMRLAVRPAVAYIQANPAVTAEMKIDAGLTVRGDKPTPSPIPKTSPFLRVVKTVGRTLTLELRTDKTTRGKPAKVAFATIFVATGPADSKEHGEFEFATTTGRTTVEIPFPPSATGDTAYVTAFWTNSAKVSGPAASAISVNLPAGGALPKPLDARETTGVKLAA